MNNLSQIDSFDVDKMKGLLSKSRLVRPFVSEENRVSMGEIKEVIEENFTKHSKWTIVRDIEGQCLQRFLSYNSVVIDMDSFTVFQATELRNTIKQAMEKGAWVTLSFKETLCTVRHLIKNKVVPEDIMDPSSVVKSKHDNFRLIFVSSKLEYPRSMLDDCILVSIDEDKCRKEKELTRLKRIKGVYKKSPKRIQKELDFLDA